MLGEGMPLVSLYDAYWDPDEFRADPAVRLDERQMPLRLGVLLTRLDPAMAGHPLGGTGFAWTFFGGRPSQPPGEVLPWPRRRDGSPLAHVMQVDLYAQSLGESEETMAPTGLPVWGLLQFFHDTETYGWDEADSDAWHVRWVPSQDEDRDQAWTAAPFPPGLTPDYQRDPVPVHGEIAPTIPIVSPVELTEEESDRYWKIYEYTNEHGYDQNLGRPAWDDNPLTPWDEGYEPRLDPSRLAGFSAVPEDEDYHPRLAQLLPVEPGDDHVLLADIHGLQLGERDWFHGGRHVEFWMRSSDLRARRFDRAWAFIRTDH